MAPSRGRGKDNRPSAKRSEPFPTPPPPPNFDLATPRFCLRYLQPGFTVTDLNAEQQASFACALARRGAMTWRELLQAPRHGLGYEMLPVSSLKPTVPEPFSDSPKVMVFRYHGKLPMAGVRVADTLHLLWLERRFGDLYDHGS